MPAISSHCTASFLSSKGSSLSFYRGISAALLTTDGWTTRTLSTTPTLLDHTPPLPTLTNINQGKALLSKITAPEFDSKRKLFHPGDTYQPVDLALSAPPSFSSPLRKGKGLLGAKPLTLLNISNPLVHYKDSEFLSLFLNDMGMIRSRAETGLSVKQQARVAKAIRRARCLGFLPFTYNPYSWQ